MLVPAARELRRASTRAAQIPCNQANTPEASRQNEERQAAPGQKEQRGDCRDGREQEGILRRLAAIDGSLHLFQR